VRPQPFTRSNTKNAAFAAVLTLAASAAIMKPVYSVPQSGMLVSSTESENSRRPPADASTMSSIAENLERGGADRLRRGSESGVAPSTDVELVANFQKRMMLRSSRSDRRANKACSAKVGSRKASKDSGMPSNSRWHFGRPLQKNKIRHALHSFE